MADVISPAVRSRMMARIRGRDTRPEIVLPSGLYRLGLCFTSNSGLPRRPDIVLSKWRFAVFYHGCFWHDKRCPLFKIPGIRTDFWRPNTDGNRARGDSGMRDYGPLFSPHAALPTIALWTPGISQLC